MTLYEKIVSIYPELGLTQDVNGRDIPNEAFINLTIMLQNDGDGRGDYIAKWEHPTLPRPTDEQLEGVQ
jgi:hypothetical protein